MIQIAITRRPVDQSSQRTNNFLFPEFGPRRCRQACRSQSRRRSYARPVGGEKAMKSMRRREWKWSGYCREVACRTGHWPGRVNAATTRCGPSWASRCAHRDPTHKSRRAPCAGTCFESPAREAAVGRTHLVAENQMCFVAAFADAFETIDGMTVILRRQAKRRS